MGVRVTMPEPNRVLGDVFIPPRTFFFPGGKPPEALDGMICIFDKDTDEELASFVPAPGMVFELVKGEGE